MELRTRVDKLDPAKLDPAGDDNFRLDLLVGIFGIVLICFGGYVVFEVVGKGLSKLITYFLHGDETQTFVSFGFCFSVFGWMLI